MPFEESSDFMFDRREGDGAKQGNASTWENQIRGQEHLELLGEDQGIP